PIDPGLLERDRGGPGRELQRLLAIGGVLLGEAALLLEPLDRSTNVAGLDPGVFVDLEQPLELGVAVVAEIVGEEPSRELLGARLREPVLRRGAGDREHADPSAHSCSLRESAESAGSGRSASGVRQVSRNTYCESFLRWLEVQSMLGRLASSGK